MVLPVEKMKVRLIGESSLLGSSPANPEIYTDYIAAANAKKEKDAARRQNMFEDADSIVPNDESIEGRITVFFRDPFDKETLILKDYQIRGFLKSAMKVLKDHLKLVAPAAKVDQYVFVTSVEGGRNIPIMRDGAPVKAPDGLYERSLRAQTAQGPRVALSSSEVLKYGDESDNSPWYVDIEIAVLANSGSAKSKAVTLDTVREALGYGELNGLLQFRNGGFGRFRWEEI